MVYEITIHNAETGETVTREMTAEETARHEALIAADAALTAEQAAAATAKAALLERLGITADEAKLLLS
jgi:hypothetical protein